MGFLHALANLPNLAPEDDFDSGQVDEGDHVDQEYEAQEAHDTRAHVPLDLGIHSAVRDKQVHGVL